MAAALLFLALQQFPTNPPQIRHAPDTEFAAIIRAVVDDRLAAKSEAPDGDYLVVADKTSGAPEFLDLSTAFLTPLAEELRSQFLVESRKTVALPPLHASNARLVPQQTIDEIFAGKGWWQEFYRRFPRSKGYLQVSKPAFSADGLNALLYVSHSCGGLCGTGWVMYLTREGRRWRIVDKKMLWIS